MSDKKQQEIVKAYLQGKISEQKMLRELDKLDGKKTAKNKYFNEKVEIDGIEFQSIKEANYYSEAKLLQITGEIIDIELQPEYELLPGFTKNGKKYRPTKYKADFKITYKDNRVEVVDTKGVKTSVFRLKQKLFEYKYPDLSLIIV